MKYLKYILIALMGLMIGCYKPANELCVPCYITDDYEYMFGQCGEDFQFCAVIVEFDRTLNKRGALAVEMNTFFETGDAIVTITHTLDTTTVSCEFGELGSCDYITTNPAIGFDSCMVLAKDILPKLNTRYLTLYRPQNSSNSWWVFGNGEYIMDAETGETIKRSI